MGSRTGSKGQVQVCDKEMNVLSLKEKERMKDKGKAESVGTSVK